LITRIGFPFVSPTNTQNNTDSAEDNTTK